MASKCFKMSATVLSIALAVTSLTACGGNKVQNDGKGADVVLNGDKIYPIQCDDTLSFWFPSDNIWQQQYSDFADTPIGKKIEKETGIKVEYILPTAGQVNEQFQVLLASDELPDIVSNNWSSFAGGPDQAIEQKYIYELDEIIDKYAPAYKKVLEEHPDWDKQVKSSSGKYYAFTPFSQGGILSVSLGPVIRNDILAKLNLEKPTTIDEWETVLAAFKDKAGMKVPWAGGFTTLIETFAPAYGIYFEWYHDDGTVKYGPAQPQYKEFLQKMNRWYKKGYIDHDFAVEDGNRDVANMLNGTSGATLAWAGSGLGAWLETNKGKEYDLEGTMYPAMKKGQIAEYSSLSSQVNGTGMVAISKNCKNIELAARFLDYGYTTDGHNVLNFGIEGESYNWIEKDGEKFPQYTDLILNNPDGLTISNMIALYCRAGHVNIPMIQDVNYIKQYYQLDQQKNAQELWVQTNMKNHLLPIIYLNPDETDEDSNIMSSVKTYIDEMSLKFIVGTESLDNFEAYIAKLEELGLNKAIKSRQEAYNRALKG